MSIPEIWRWEGRTEYTIQSIKKISQTHTVTHLVTYKGIPSQMHLLLPHLTHLRVIEVQPSDLQK